MLVTDLLQIYKLTNTWFHIKTFWKAQELTIFFLVVIQLKPHESPVKKIRLTVKKQTERTV
jgi:hypothetical protein